MITYKRFNELMEEFGMVKSLRVPNAYCFEQEKGFNFACLFSNRDKKVYCAEGCVINEEGRPSYFGVVKNKSETIFIERLQLLRKEYLDCKSQIKINLIKDMCK